MARKKIEQAAQQNRSVVDSIVTPVQVEHVDQDEANALMEAQETRGHKGLKMPRINAAFTPSNYEYLRVMAGIRGETITKYLNSIVERDREANATIYAQAKKLVESANE